jgi:hypothetical protein
MGDRRTIKLEVPAHSGGQPFAIYHEAGVVKVTTQWFTITLSPAEARDFGRALLDLAAAAEADPGGRS